jgi:hypothetical protein
MQNFTRNLAKSSLAAAVAAGSLASVSPALAIQSDATIDQVALATSGSAWLVDQVGAPASASGHMAQIDAPAINPNAAFQANLAAKTTQLSMADQVPNYAGSYGAPVEMAFLGYGLDLGRFVRAGKGASFASDDSGNSQRHAWNGDENLQASLQRGSDNRSIQDQNGFRNASLVVQDGEANFAEVTQSANFTVASILQVGSRNSASLYQGTGSSFALVSQAGVGNIVSIRQ